MREMKSKSKVFRFRSDRRDHALRVLVSGLYGQARTDRMVELLKDPDHMWQLFRRSRHLSLRTQQQ